VNGKLQLEEEKTQHPLRPTFLLSPCLIALLLFIIAFLPRLPGLHLFLTSDENTNIFFAGSDVIAAFLQGDWRSTYWHFYPGVTMSWLDALGMSGQYLLDLLTGVPVPPFAEYIYGDILSLVVANRLPYAILTAAAVPALYLLARQLLPERVAIFGALFMAFDPFYLAHSRVAHGDAPVAVFMSLSALAFFVYGERVIKQTDEPTSLLPFLRQSSTFYLVLSAILGSLAALTKAPGQFMALFVISMSAIYAGLEWRQTKNAVYAVRRWLTVVIVWGIVSLVIFILLWPSMWVDPIGTLQQMWTETFGKVDEGHLVYFLGRPTLDPGIWFYLYVIPFRMTPILLIGSLLSLAILIPKISLILKTGEVELRSVFFLWLFTISLLLFGNLSPKKQDRYLLPLFPLLNILAAVGWFGLLDLIVHTLNAHISIRRSNLSFLVYGFLTLILLLIHFLPTVTYYPYYLTYFNPLLGGPTRAAETTLMGWGEGMEQVAAYLNTKPNAANLYVASTPSQTLLPYFEGTGENFYTNDVAFRADYVVLYLAQMQRLAPSPEIVRYFEAQEPERVITIKDVPYAKIYPGPKLILADIPPEATLVNIGLDNIIRLAGYQIQNPNNLNPRLTLYWHALAPLLDNYTVSVRARSADGRVLVQQDSWPVDGLLPTSHWRQGDYVADTHTLEIPEDEVGQLDHFEIVVYNQETGQILGPPIILPGNKIQ
jgi:hypothetical protein